MKHKRFENTIVAKIYKGEEILDKIKWTVAKRF